MKYSFTMSYEDVAKGAVLTGKRSATLKQDIHKMNVSILHQWMVHGDASHAARTAATLLAATDKYYSQPLVNWFKVHGGFDYDPKNEEQPFTYTKTKITADEVKAAKNETFEQLTPAPKAKPMNFLAELQKVIAKADKHLAKSVEDDEVDAEQVFKVKQFLASLQA